MLYVGIDVAKNKHDICVLDNDGKVVVRNLQIENNREGFTRMQMVFANLTISHEDMIEVALEDTGHYAYNIVRFLRTNGYPTFSYNPLLIKEFASAHSLRKTKTDKKDALTIARKLRDDHERTEFEFEPIMIELKYATRNMGDWKTKEAQQKTSYTRLLDLLFPELSSVIGEAKKAKHNKYVYELLKKYPSAKKLAKARVKTITNIISKASRGRVGQKKAVEILKVAKESIGQNSPCLEFQLLQTIDSIEYFRSLHEQAKAEVEKLMEKINTPLTSIPGVGVDTAAVILAEIRNIDNFANPGQLLAFAGSEPSISTSGENQKQSGHMVKHGSPRLRNALQDAAKGCRLWSPKMRKYYLKKMDEGKHFNVVIPHVVKKLVRIIFHMLKYGNCWDEEKLVIN